MFCSIFLLCFEIKHNHNISEFPFLPPNIHIHPFSMSSKFIASFSQSLELHAYMCMHIYSKYSLFGRYSVTCMSVLRLVHMLTICMFWGMHNWQWAINWHVLWISTPAPSFAQLTRVLCVGLTLMDFSHTVSKSHWC